MSPFTISIVGLQVKHLSKLPSRGLESVWYRSSVWTRARVRYVERMDLDELGQYQSVPNRG